MSEFSRNVLQVLSGSMFVNVFSYATLPLLTILYDPDAFGLYNLVLGGFALFNGISSLRYDMAIIVMGPNKKGDYMALLAVWILLVATVLICVFLLFGKNLFLGWMNAEALGNYVWLVPIFVLLAGFRTILTQLAANAKDFKLFTINSVLLTVGQRGGSLLLGLFSGSFISLCIAHLTAFVLTSANLMRKYRIDWSLYHPKRLYALARANWKYPTFDTGSVFMNTLSLWLPAFMLSGYYGPALVGLYGMADRLLDRPFKMLANGLGAVYFPTASQAFLEGKSVGLMALYKKILFRLVALFVPIFIGVYFLAPWLADNFLAAKWEGVGEIIQILVVIKFFQVLNNPFSKTFLILNKQEIAFGLIAFSVVLRFASMYFFREDPINMLWAFSIAGGLFYAIYNIFIYRSIKLHGS